MFDAASAFVHALHLNVISEVRQKFTKLAKNTWKRLLQETEHYPTNFKAMGFWLAIRA